ncbi:MAG: fumarylacetoacetate hydrolase family protein [Bdellovibrionales bacterium]|nr:fumarylacetoacetate hydrolase family protein [Bdellovibrionales bacterium]
MDKLICVGKNYLKHAQELGDAVPEEPLYFLKPPSTLFEMKDDYAEVEWPEHGGELHHELELVLRLSQHGSQFYFTHYTFGLDMTLRDLQGRLKKAGQPWEKAKTFQNACVVGPWRPLSNLEIVLDIPFALAVDGIARQTGHGRDMRWKPDELLKDVARWFPLRDGDLLFTGTPEGVGPVKNGEILEIRGGDIHYKVKCRRA